MNLSSRSLIKIRILFYFFFNFLVNEPQSFSPGAAHVLGGTAHTPAAALILKRAVLAPRGEYDLLLKVAYTGLLCLM